MWQQSGRSPGPWWEIDESEFGLSMWIPQSHQCRKSCQQDWGALDYIAEDPDQPLMPLSRILPDDVLPSLWTPGEEKLKMWFKLL